MTLFGDFGREQVFDGLARMEFVAGMAGAPKDFPGRGWLARIDLIYTRPREPARSRVVLVAHGRLIVHEIKLRLVRRRNVVEAVTDNPCRAQRS